MLELHGVLLLLLWLIAAAGIFFFARWLSQFLRQTELSTDIQVLVLVAFVGLLIVATLNFLWEYAANPSAKPRVRHAASSNTPTNAQPLDAFESQAYPELYGLRQQMLAQLNALDQFVTNVQAWATQMPAQRQFLQRVLDIRWERRKQLKQAYHEIDMSRREFWLHYHAGQNTHVRKMFDTEAERLQQRIKDALGASRKAQWQEEAVIQDFLRDCGTLLKQKSLPTVKPTKTNPKPFSSPYIPSFEAYGERNYRALHTWLTQRQENGILSNLEQLRQEEAQIRGKIAYILEYRKLNSDLSEQISSLVKRWNEALKFNQYAQYRLLFATEALAVTALLSAPDASTQARPNQEDAISLVIQIRQHAPQLLQAAQQERMVAEFSYQPEVEHRTQRLQR